MPSKKSWPKITTHTIVKNEDRWIWYVIKSVIDQVDRLLIYDTGSTDLTAKIIKSFKSDKIVFQKKSVSTREALVQLRLQQLKMTQTSWFMVLDGDEIWPEKNLSRLISAAKQAKKNTLALVNRTRNCVGDIFHYLPESKGHYRIKGKIGHLNIRLIRNIPNLIVQGSYPLEAYTLNNQPIQKLDSRLEFVDTWYLHTSHLPRSTSKSSETAVIDRINKQKFRLGLKMTRREMPQVFWQPRPKFVPPPITNRWLQLFKSIINL